MKKKNNVAQWMAGFALVAGTMFLADAQAMVKMDAKCKSEFERVCLGRKPFVVGPFDIVEPLDTINYCNTKINEGALTCSFHECTDRLDIMYAFKLPQSRGNRCVSQKW